MARPEPARRPLWPRRWQTAAQARRGSSGALASGAATAPAAIDDDLQLAIVDDELEQLVNRRLFFGVVSSTRQAR